MSVKNRNRNIFFVVPLEASKPTIIDCVEILEKGQWDKDIELNPEDIITVPEKLINLF